MYPSGDSTTDSTSRPRSIVATTRPATGSMRRRLLPRPVGTPNAVGSDQQRRHAGAARTDARAEGWQADGVDDGRRRLPWIDEHAIDDGGRVRSVRARQHPHRPEPGADRQWGLELPDLGHRGGASIGPIEHRRGEAVAAWCPEDLLRRVDVGEEPEPAAVARGSVDLVDDHGFRRDRGDPAHRESRGVQQPDGVVVGAGDPEAASIAGQSDLPRKPLRVEGDVGRGQRRGLDAHEMPAVGREPELAAGVDDPTGAAPAGTHVMVAPIFSAPMGLGVGPSVAVAVATAVGASTAAVVAGGCTSAGRAGDPHGLRNAITTNATSPAATTISERGRGRAMP